MSNPLGPLAGLGSAMMRLGQTAPGIREASQAVKDLGDVAGNVPTLDEILLGVGERNTARIEKVQSFFDSWGGDSFTQGGQWFQEALGFLGENPMGLISAESTKAIQDLREELGFSREGDISFGIEQGLEDIHNGLHSINRTLVEKLTEIVVNDEKLNGWIEESLDFIKGIHHGFTRTSNILAAAGFEA